jgi:pyruvate-ferredoxin/flavodoxin oxidoreductase
LTFDPDNGPLFADALSLDGNPSVDERWPEYSIDFVDDEGASRRVTLPLTVADWAATEGRFRKHFKSLDQSKWNEDAVPFHEYVDLSADDRDGKTPYIVTVDRDKHLARLAVSSEIVRLAEERQELWAQLRELAGLRPADSVRDRLIAGVQAEYEGKLAAIRAEYEAKLAELPRVVARRMADVLLRGSAAKSVVDLVVPPAPTNGKSATTSVATVAPVAPVTVAPAAPAAPAAAAAVTASASFAVQAASAASVAVDDDLAIDAHIDSARCTSCNECINLNSRLFAYNPAKQATVGDPAAGTFQQLVVAAERCPVGIIHPGTPRNPKEKDLTKWLKRAEPFA